MSTFRKKKEMYKCSESAWTYAWSLFGNSYKHLSKWMHNEMHIIYFLFIEYKMHILNLFFYWMNNNMKINSIILFFCLFEWDFENAWMHEAMRMHGSMHWLYLKQFFFE